MGVGADLARVVGRVGAVYRGPARLQDGHRAGTHVLRFRAILRPCAPTQALPVFTMRGGAHA